MEEHLEEEPRYTFESRWYFGGLLRYTSYRAIHSYVLATLRAYHYYP